MKSSKEELMQRGYVDEDSIRKAECLDDEALLKQCSSALAWERSAAVYALKQPDRYAEFYVRMLSAEKKLYTKIACCEVLAKGNEERVKVLIHWLGKIGSNQHHAIDETSKKKSYPLPRDIIARILARMDGVILPMLFSDDVFKDEIKLSEALDAIGFMVFYNQKLVDIQYVAPILKLLDHSNDLIRWKAVTACGAFPLLEVRDKLLTLHMDHDAKNLYPEIKRSLNLMNDRMKE